MSTTENVFNIPVTSREGVRIKTAGKYSDKDIVVTPAVEEIIKLQDKTVIANGDYTPDTGYDGMGKVTVAIEGEVSALQEKVATPTTSEQSILPDEGYDALSKVTVEAMTLEEKKIITSGVYTPAEGVDGFSKVDVDIPLQEKTITTSGDYTPDEGYEGFSQVHVKIDESEVVLQEKNVQPTTEEQSVVPDKGYDGLNKVVVGAIKLEEKTITESGEHTPSEDMHGFSKVVVDIQGGGAVNLQDKSVSPTTSEQIIIADEEYDGLKQVTVAAMKLQSTTITANGTYTHPDYDGYDQITVNVSDSDFTLEETEVKSSVLKQIVKPSENADGFSVVTVNPIVTEKLIVNGEGTYTPNEGVDGFSEVAVDVALQDKTFTTNGTFTPDTGYVGFGSVTVDTEDTTLVLQEKTVTPSAEEQSVVADSEYNGLSKVTVEAIQLQEKTVKSTAEQQTINPDDGVSGFSTITVEPVKTEKLTVDKIDTYTPADGIDGFSEVVVDMKLQNKTIEGDGTYTPDVGYIGFGEIIVATEGATVKTQEKTAVPSTEEQVVAPDDGYNGLSKVTISGIQTETIAVTPTKEVQIKTPTDGKYLTSVTVESIPDEYIIPANTCVITKNGEGFDVTKFKYVNVEVPIPDSYVKTESDNGDGIAVDFAYLLGNGISDNNNDIASATTEEEMTAYATEENVGSVVTYTGETTETYEKGRMYIVEQI